jgi:nicotinamidase-related amidase
MIALLIIDMQNGMFKDDTPRYESDKVINRINLLSAATRQHHGTVILIQHDGNQDNGYVPDTEEWQIIPQIQTEDKDIIVHKTTCDSFYKTNLDNILSENKINSIIITGCATDYCVDTTVRAATSKDYNVIIAKDGHTTADRPYLKAKQVILHHNWIWENLILPKKNIKVISTNQIIEFIKNELEK